MKTNGTSVFSNGLIWFGAAVSIAEIEVGTQLASSAAGGRFGMVLLAMLLGHIVGGFLLFGIGLIGAGMRMNGMDCVKVPFGRIGASFFAGANVLQLIGWTAVMIATGATAAKAMLQTCPVWALCVVLGLLVALWIRIGLGNAVKLNTIAMALLFVLSLVLFVRVSGGGTEALEAAKAPLGFWDVIELSIAMPLSWLPLIADYTKEAERPVPAVFASALIYTITSCWMYGIGLSAAYCLGKTDIGQIMLLAGPGAIGLLIVVFSTVTTTFLDAYSAGESAKSLWSRMPAKWFGVAVCAVGVVLAIDDVMDRYLDFLYLIASVFAPMAAVQLVDYFVLRHRVAASGGSVVSILAWAVGFCVYHLCLGASSPFVVIFSGLESIFTRIASPFGASLPAMVVAAVVAIVLSPFCRNGRQVERRQV
ncbi:MAG: putative hydroxymethylpyrimidine transporter CytX [Kiritimatiellia bacterium]